MFFIDAVERCAEVCHLALHVLQLFLFCGDLLFIGLHKRFGAAFRIFYKSVRLRVCVVHNLLGLRLCLADGSIAKALCAEDCVLNTVFLCTVRLNFCSQNRKLLLQLGVFRL